MSQRKGAYAPEFRQQMVELSGLGASRVNLPKSLVATIRA